MTANAYECFVRTKIHPIEIKFFRGSFDSIRFQKTDKKLIFIDNRSGGVYLKAL